MEHDRDMFSTKEASSFLNIAVRTLLKWTKEGKIQAYRLGKTNYYRREDLVGLYQAK